MHEAEARVAVVEICRRMHARGLNAAADGSVSVRLGETRLLVTPSGMRQGLPEPEDLVVTDLAGRTVSGAGQPNSEIRMHLLVYGERPDVQAVVHGHPPMATTMALAGESRETPFTDEAAITLQALVKLSNAIVIDRHGALAAGRTLEEAYSRLEGLEQSARLTDEAPTLGPAAEPSPEQLERIRAVAQQRGLPGPPTSCDCCSGCPQGSGPTAAAPAAGSARRARPRARRR